MTWSHSISFTFERELIKIWPTGFLSGCSHGWVVAKLTKLKPSKPFRVKMADEDSHSTARNLLSPETTTCRPTCKKPINGTNIKFTFCSLSLQIVLIVLFMVLVDYGDHSLPTLESTGGSAGTATPATKESKETANDISLYYPSKCRDFQIDIA